MPLNLYLISQDEKTGWDIYDSAVVCAEDEESARNIHPQEQYEWNKNEPWDSSTWCSSTAKVKVTYLGIAREELVRGVVCASYNAG